MLNIGLHKACKQKDVASALEVSESGSGCSAEVGEAVTGAGHAVHARESPVLSCLFVKSQPHPWAIFSDAYFPHAYAADKQAGYVSETPVSQRDTDSSGQAHPSHAGPGGVSLPAAPRAGISRQGKPGQHSNTLSIPAAGTCL